MERETKIIETPIGKHKIEMKGWLTGGEAEQIEDVFLEDVEVGVDAENVGLGTLEASKIRKARDKMIEVVIVSIDDSKENILKRLKDMHRDDYAFVMAEVDKVAQPQPAQKKSQK